MDLIACHGWRSAQTKVTVMPTAKIKHVARANGNSHKIFLTIAARFFMGEFSAITLNRAGFLARDDLAGGADIEVVELRGSFH